MSTSSVLIPAALLVAADRNRWLDDDEQMSVLEAVREARNVLRLPEAPPVPGAFPLEEDDASHNPVTRAYRTVLEASQDDIDGLEIVVVEGFGQVGTAQVVTRREVLVTGSARASGFMRGVVVSDSHFPETVGAKTIVPVADLAGGGRTVGPIEIVPPSNVTQIDVVREMRAAYPTPLLADAIKALDAACVEHGLEGYDGEAVSYLTALLRMAEDPSLSAEDAVKRAYGLGSKAGA